jgi:serine/threonine protein kinase
MDQTTSARSIVDIFGFCGISVLVDYIGGPSANDFVITEDSSNLDLNPTEKLNIALDMAEGIAELHGFEWGVTVNNDIQYVQFLLDENKRAYLSDFNRAAPMSWDEENEEYCGYYEGRANGELRAPEEYMEELLDEKIDVFSFGNVLYTLLTRRESYDMMDDYYEEWRPLVVQGIVQTINSEIKGNSFAESALSSVMEKCFEYYPAQRLDIFKVVSLLRDAVKMNSELENIVVTTEVKIPEDYYEHEEEE